jgi:hypothetical protein
MDANVDYRGRILRVRRIAACARFVASEFTNMGQADEQGTTRDILI